MMKYIKICLEDSASKDSRVLEGEGQDLCWCLDKIEDLLDVNIVFEKNPEELYKAFTNSKGGPWPGYDDLPDNIKEAWQAAAGV